jgi:hypothetical protein
MIPSRTTARPKLDPSGPVFTPAQTKNPVGKGKISVLLATIDGINAKREGRDRIHLQAKVRNDNIQDLVSVAWVVSCWDGVSWKKVKNGDLSIKFGPGSMVELDLTPQDLPDCDFRADLKFKLEVTPSQQRSVQSNGVGKLPVYVLQYRCTEWTFIDSWQDARDINAEKQFTDLSLETKWEVETIKWSFPAYYKQTWRLYVRSVDWQERTFETPEQRQDFAVSLPKFVVTMNQTR